MGFGGNTPFSNGPFSAGNQALGSNGLSVAPGYQLGLDGKIYDAQGNVVNDMSPQSLQGQPVGQPMSSQDQAGSAAMNGMRFPGISAPGLEKLLQMHMGALNIGAMRPEQAQARTNALQNQLSAFQPMNRAMQSMYGPGGGVDLGKLGQNPMGPRMMGVGQPNPTMGLDRPPTFQPSGSAPGAQQPVGPQVQAIMRLLQGQ